ncbi:MAG: hypothetical protein KF880_06780 [Ferruginibacter sp.]|nr:hypothetical protein [Ferruginibacter sp.]
MLNSIHYVVFVLASLFAPLAVEAQNKETLNGQFMEILLSFPSKFSTINDGTGKYSLKGHYRSKVQIDGTVRSALKEDIFTGKLEFVSIILSDENKDLKEFENAFNTWKKIIAALDLNGAKLVPYVSDRHKDNDMYIQTAAWRLDNSKNNIESKYSTFTIWLQLLDLDQGGYMVEIVVSDE